MANFFSRSYSKAGPGISKEAPQKKRFFQFFELLGRHFGQIIGAGLLFLVCCIPVVTFGPASCGLMLVLRNISREEHTFVVHDFFRGFKENWKQGGLIGLLNLAAIALSGFACWYYYTEMQDNGIMMVFFAITLLCVIFELFMSFYAYMMIVTFTLPTKKLIKNSFLFSLLGIRTNIITLALILLMAFLTFFLFTVLPALLVVIPIVVVPIVLFIVGFNAYGPIKKFLIDPQTEKKDEVGGEGEDENVFTDDLL